MHTPEKITEFYAWVCTEEDGGDGVLEVLEQHEPKVRSTRA